LVREGIRVASYRTRALQYPRVLFTIRIVAAARVGGAQGTRAAGLRLQPVREKGFPSNLLLALIDTSPLSLSK
jgi:hypothetical protein